MLLYNDLHFLKMSVKIQQLHNTNILNTFSLSCIPPFVCNTIATVPSARRVGTAPPQTYISLAAHTLNTGHQPAYVPPSFLKLTLMAAQKHYTLSHASPAFCLTSLSSYCSKARPCLLNGAYNGAKCHRPKDINEYGEAMTE